MTNGPEKPNKHTGLRIAVAAGVVGGGVAGGLTIKTILDELSKPRAAAEQVVPMPTNTVEIKGGTATIVPNIPKETPTAPAPTATLTTYNYPTPVKTPTETTKPVEKSPIKTYDAYYGYLTNPQTGAKEGTIVLASIPQKSGPDQIFIFYEKSDRSFNAYLANLQEIQGNNFKGRNVANSWASAGLFAVEGVFDSLNKKIAGTIFSDRRIMGTMTHEESKFVVNYFGNGKDKTTEAAKKAKWENEPGKYGVSDWNQVRIDELKSSFGITLP